MLVVCKKEKTENGGRKWENYQGEKTCPSWSANQERGDDQRTTIMVMGEYLHWQQNSQGTRSRCGIRHRSARQPVVSELKDVQRNPEEQTGVEPSANTHQIPYHRRWWQKAESCEEKEQGACPQSRGRSRRTKCIRGDISPLEGSPLGVEVEADIDTRVVVVGSAGREWEQDNVLLSVLTLIRRTSVEAGLRP